jgi:hypothetical protein
MAFSSSSWLDGTHLVLMLAALVLAFALPFELVVFSYAVLGPAHYLTEISWLHEKSYFLPHRFLVVALLLATALMVALRGNFTATSFILICLLSVCGALAFTREWAWRAIVGGIGLIVGLALASYGPAAFFVTIMIPSLVHVSLFTFIFILVGYLNSGSRFQMLLASVYVSSIALILIYPPASAHSAEMAKLASRYFGGLSEALADVIGKERIPLDGRLSGLLSLVYTYHYLNWFIKVRVINWHKISKPRLAGIAGLSATATGLYLYDYSLGLKLLFSLSMLHVVLEFPLNAITFRRLVAGTTAVQLSETGLARSRSQASSAIGSSS